MPWVPCAGARQGTGTEDVCSRLDMAAETGPFEEGIDLLVAAHARAELKKSKAGGSDDIVADMLLELDAEAVESIALLFNANRDLKEGAPASCG